MPNPARLAKPQWYDILVDSVPDRVTESAGGRVYRLGKLLLGGEAETKFWLTRSNFHC